MTFEHWLLFAAVEFVAYLVPGPAVLLIVSQALAFGARSSFWAMLGLLLAEVMFFVLSSFGLGLLLVGSHNLFLVVKWVGAAYLVWLGVQTLRGRGDTVEAIPGRPSKVNARWATMRGFITNAANPKALLVYVAILPQFINPSQPAAPQFFILGVTSIALGAAVFAAYAVASGRMAASLRSPRFERYTRAGSGTLLIGVGVSVALAENH
ncbi:MAG TPA: LysE family translocator [Deltaproteobacteria bacterium]|nr:LysE family translocator [Deltaproteobacteria bacterium]HPR54423.1 LysE family translocator [Deltaproteobacteria bacterium]HXK46248.1 LysE family translocator [Deltaproteobacteria bacterium]